MSESRPKNLSWQAGEKLTQHAKNVLKRSEDLARHFKYNTINLSHLALATLEETGSLGKSILEDIKVTREALEKIIQDSSPQFEEISKSSLTFDESARLAVLKAYSTAKDFQYPYVGTEHLVYAILSFDDPQIQKALIATKDKNQSLPNIHRALKSFFRPDELANLSKIFQIPEISLSAPSKNKPSSTPFINNFCRNLNEEVIKNREVFIGREKELERLINILGRKQKNNPLLIGEPGVGKTALVSQLAQKINEGAVPDFLLGKKIMNLDVALLIAGTSFRGEFESRLKEILKETQRSGNIILFIDEIHNIVGAGNLSGSLDLANILKPALARGEIRLIGATTFNEYKRHIEKDAALCRRFQTVILSEPTPKEAEKISIGLQQKLEEYHGVSFSPETLTAAVQLSLRYLPDRFLPDKAIDILDESASRVKSLSRPFPNAKKIISLENQQKKLIKEKERLVKEENYSSAENVRKNELILEQEIQALKKTLLEETKNRTISITLNDLWETVSQMSGIPKEKISQTKLPALKNIQSSLSRKVFGQEEAIEKIASALKRAYAGLGQPDRPMGSFLFLGPTGVGKTFTAQTLSEQIFGSDKNLIKIDMSELSERHQVASLIGAPAGYVGYGEGGRLTEKIRRHPYSVILFDEIEKAHPEVSNIFLQILEDGKLTDSEGTQADFKNTIVIFTSNSGSESFAQSGKKMGFHSSQSLDFSAVREEALQTLKKQFRPEFLDRLDNIVVFHPLDKKALTGITKLSLQKIKDQLKEKEIILSVDRKIPLLVSQSIIKAREENPTVGARDIRKYLQEKIENPLSDIILESSKRPLHLYARTKGDKIVIEN